MYWQQDSVNVLLEHLQISHQIFTIQEKLDATPKEPKRAKNERQESAEVGVLFARRNTRFML